jgi:ribosomal protein S6E (S10)
MIDKNIYIEDFISVEDLISISDLTIKAKDLLDHPYFSQDKTAYMKDFVNLTQVAEVLRKHVNLTKVAEVLRKRRTLVPTSYYKYPLIEVHEGTGRMIATLYAQILTGLGAIILAIGTVGAIILVAYIVRILNERYKLRRLRLALERKEARMEKKLNPNEQERHRLSLIQKVLSVHRGGAVINVEVESFKQLEEETMAIYRVLSGSGTTFDFMMYRIAHENIERELAWSANLESVFKVYMAEVKVPTLKRKDRFKRLKIKDRFKGLKIKDRFKRLKIKDRFKGLKIKDRFKGLKIKDRFKGLKIKDRFKGLKIKDRSQIVRNRLVKTKDWVTSEQVLATLVGIVIISSILSSSGVSGHARPTRTDSISTTISSTRSPLIKSEDLKVVDSRETIELKPEMKEAALKQDITEKSISGRSSRVPKKRYKTLADLPPLTEFSEIVEEVQSTMNNPSPIKIRVKE